MSTSVSTDNLERREYSHWEALTAFEDAIARGAEGDKSVRTDLSGNRWTGATVDETLTMLRVGYDVSIGTFAVTPNVSIADVPRPSLMWDMAGSQVDVAAYLEGRPDCMGELVNMPVPRPLIRIGVDRAASGDLDPDKLLSVGVSVCTVVESLRTRGYPVEVWACQAVNPSGGRAGSGSVFDLRVQVQSAEQPVHYGRIAYWVAHPSALRRVMFALEESETASERAKWGFGRSSGYGIPRPGVAKLDFEEWAPSGQANVSAVQAWAVELLGRRHGDD